MHYKTLLLTTLLICCVVIGCTVTPKEAEAPSSPAAQKNSSVCFHKAQFHACTPVDTTGYLQKVDNFMIIFDPSASMTEPATAPLDCMSCHTRFQDNEFAEKHAVSHGSKKSQSSGLKNLFSSSHSKNVSRQDLLNSCSECHQKDLSSKLEFARNLTVCFNQTIPDFDYSCELRTFGYPVYTQIGNRPAPYDRKKLGHKIRSLYEADGASPLWVTLRASGKDWQSYSRKLAVFIISDGMGMGKKEILEAEQLSLHYGENICIYTIQIGHDPQGEKTLKEIAAQGACGAFIQGSRLADEDEMKNYIRTIFLEQAPPPPPPVKDSDNDGVADEQDDCPDTEPGVAVDENGCWKLSVIADLLFDFDKYVLRPEGEKELDKVVALMKKHASLHLHVRGHTDNYGSEEYNTTLSKNRTLAGVDYLKKEGIPAERISSSWHAASVPVATNETAEGRQLNRRLEFTFTQVKENK